MLVQRIFRHDLLSLVQEACVKQRGHTQVDLGGRGHGSDTGDTGQGRLPCLTSREQEVLRHLAEGGTDQEIADALELSVWTVRTHLRNLYRKLEVRNRLEATLRWMRRTRAES